jgi:hypothetical protein
MPRGKKLHPQVQEIIVRLSGIFNKQDVATYTGIPLRSIERILQHFNTFGFTENGETERRKHGPKRQLRDVDVEV